MVQVKNLIEMMRIATELSSHVAIGPMIMTLQESLPHLSFRSTSSFFANTGLFTFSSKPCSYLVRAM